MKNINLFCLILALIISSCAQHDPSNENSVGIIGLNEAFSNARPLNINDISTDLEFVRLETRDACLTGTRLFMYSNDQNLVAVDQARIMLFDRTNGKFIKEIGRKGNGPGEYSRTYVVMPIDEENNLVYAGRNKSRYGYSFDGQLKDTLPIPELVSEVGNIEDNVFAAFMPDYQGGEKKKILLFNRHDSILKTYPNYLSAPNTNGFFVWNPNAWFYRVNRQLCFFQIFNDTVFSVEKTKLAPKYVFDMGPYSPPYEMKTSQNFESEKYFIMRAIQESSGYLFFSFNFNRKNYTAIYDKSAKTVIVNDYSPETGHGFINNTNDFVPLEFSSINDNDELICTMNAFSIREWFDKNPEKADRLPDHLKALKDIQETNNPVVAIAKLKHK